MYRKPSEVSVEDWGVGYKLWLHQGYNLDMVGRHLGLRPKSGRSVMTYLNKHFGRAATDPIANSFVRSMADDYPDSAWVKELSPQDNRGSGRFMSRTVERGISTKGIAKKVGNRSNEMRYRINYQESIAQSYDPWEALEGEPHPLRLAMFRVISDCVCELLSPIVGSEVLSSVQL